MSAQWQGDRIELVTKQIQDQPSMNISKRTKDAKIQLSIRAES